jgi:hypothetical protein
MAASFSITFLTIFRNLNHSKHLVSQMIQQFKRRELGSRTRGGQHEVHLCARVRVSFDMLDPRVAPRDRSCHRPGCRGVCGFHIHKIEADDQHFAVCPVFPNVQLPERPHQHRTHIRTTPCRCAGPLSPGGADHFAKGRLSAGRASRAAAMTDTGYRSVEKCASPPPANALPSSIATTWRQSPTRSSRVGAPSDRRAREHRERSDIGAPPPFRTRAPADSPTLFRAGDSALSDGLSSRWV